MVIHNEIFDSYRAEVNKIDDAMRLLVKYKYKIIDLENQLIDSTNIDRHTERVRYNRVPKHRRVYLKTNNDLE
ncbi:MAG: hypothetical protein Unbinned92contig1002_19 [Prokaryotic dsDNA virus sp.]|nr:MAG: hypothetical protein Unbinned92contig1002_19 [Prokaryotic dsDNA virus sp.]|tara:strand:- start:30246 stop:30464 length:219 start_codon:yes stop_codon:yes gene_type:complete